MIPSTNPFAVLGLPERPDLDDETVRAAWRAIAVATHPDRADGGDLPRYTQATAAFHELRCPWGRSEAYADLVDQAFRDGRWNAYPDPFQGFDDDTDDEPPPGGTAEMALLPPPFWLAHPLAALAQLPGRIIRGRPLRMLIRAAVAAGLCLAVLALIPGRRGAAVLVALLIGWFAVAARSDLAPPPG
jgi:hypothetical protein